MHAITHTHPYTHTHDAMRLVSSSPSHALHSSPLDTPASTRARRLDDGQRPPPHHAQRLRPTLTPHAQQQLAPRRPTETLQCMASARPRSHPARADTAPTLTHATRDRPTRARARRRSSGVCARPAPHSPAPKEHGTPMPPPITKIVTRTGGFSIEKTYKGHSPEPPTLVVK